MAHSGLEVVEKAGRGRKTAFKFTSSHERGEELL